MACKAFGTGLSLSGLFSTETWLKINKVSAGKKLFKVTYLCVFTVEGAFMLPDNFKMFLFDIVTLSGCPLYFEYWLMYHSIDRLLLSFCVRLSCFIFTPFRQRKACSESDVAKSIRSRNIFSSSGWKSANRIKKLRLLPNIAGKEETSTVKWNKRCQIIHR